MTVDATPNNNDLATLIQTKRGKYLDVLRELLAKSAEGEEALQHEIAGHFKRLGCQVETFQAHQIVLHWLRISRSLQMCQRLSE